MCPKTALSIANLSLICPDVKIHSMIVIKYSLHVVNMRIIYEIRFVNMRVKSLKYCSRSLMEYWR